MNPLRFTLDDARQAYGDWRFNCGPASLCALLSLTPREVRPRLLDFERKGYTNPTLMFSILRGMGTRHRQTYRSDDSDWAGKVPFGFGTAGLVRVQWGGPWTAPGVPPAARYRHTHWAAFAGGQVFDVNAMGVGGWLPFAEWSDEMVPWLIRECCPKGDGLWWPTHVVEVEVPRCD